MCVFVRERGDVVCRERERKSDTNFCVIDFPVVRQWFMCQTAKCPPSTVDNTGQDKYINLGDEIHLDQ